MNATRKFKKMTGFSLIEVLIALVILSVGLLGIAAMVSVSLKSKDSSFMRTQATTLTSAILDRMRANRATATANGYDVTFTGALPSTPPSGGCITATSTNSCSPTDIAAVDLQEWRNDLANLPCGVGSISTVINNQMTQATITVQWSDQRANTTTTLAACAGTIQFAITSGL